MFSKPLSLILTLFFVSIFNFLTAQSQPNVIIIITDDQGYGDLGITGNPHIQTPVIDQFAKESVTFSNFYVSPVCAPTRSSLMTGRHSLRTGIRDTYNGGAIMATSEITLAEILKDINYRTGAFGKWHLGDNYPSRPMDQGFDESVIHLAGGMGQVGDFTTYYQFEKSYFDPVLWHNGKQQAYEGYCSDIFTDQAIDFIEQNKDEPFFCYLAFNAPHTPLQVPDEYYQKYKDIDPSAGFEKDERPFYEMSEKNKEDARKVYAMVDNIDDNLGRLFKKLDDLKITDETIIIFMTDNGPQQTRYLAGLRGRKASVYQGGVRVPFFMKYPSSTPKQIDVNAAHFDIVPTIAELCGANTPTDRVIDGKSLVPLLNDSDVDWANRSLFFYWTRKYPERYQNIALQKGPYKLIGHTDYNATIEDFELFNLQKDPYEQNNIVKEEKFIGGWLKEELEIKYEELIKSENLINQPLIEVGTIHENPMFLNRNDASGSRGIWRQEEIFGYWKVHINKGKYNLKIKFIEPVEGEGTMYLEAGERVFRMKAPKGSIDILEMEGVELPDMDCDLIPFYAKGGKRIFPFWIEMEKFD